MTRPSTRTLEAACELLAMCASQRDWVYGCRTMPGFGNEVSEVAEAALREAGIGRNWYADDRWPMGYAEAEAALRCQIEERGRG